MTWKLKSLDGYIPGLPMKDLEDEELKLLNPMQQHWVRTSGLWYPDTNPHRETGLDYADFDAIAKARAQAKESP